MRTIAFALGFVVGGSLAHANLVTGFEPDGVPPYSGSAGGTLLTFGFGNGGQNGWFQPVNGGLDKNVYTYGGNALGFNQNPTGGKQFIAGTSGGGSAFPRAEQLHDFTVADTWTIGYDFAALWLGQGASAPNLSSASLQSSVSARSFIALNNFIDLNDPSAGWKAEYNIFDANNNALLNQSPGAEWTKLELNHWYRQTTSIDFVSNSITEVTLTDLTTNTTWTANPQGWYLLGGAAGNAPYPTAFRFFEGGALGNTMGWDNLSIIPAPGAAALLGLGMLGAARRRRA